MLQIDAVRRRAEGIRGVREVVPTSGRSPQFASFLVGLLDELPPDVTKLARVTVFTSGTISISRVLLGQVRQTFRRNVSELDAVEKILRDPPVLTAIDHSLVLNDDNHTIRSKIELADIGLAILQGEKEKLESLRSSILQRTAPDKEESSKMEKKQPNVGLDLTQGMEFQFSLPASSMKHVDQCLSDISSMNKLVKKIATNGKSTVFLYGNGGVAYTPLIPRPLYQKLSQLRNSRMDSRPVYVALGSRDRFFCAFYDGSFTLKGPKELDKELKQCLKPPRSVAFANAWDSYFVVLDNGEWKYHGRSIPVGLKEKLHERKGKTDLVCVNLGPSGEWFLKAENGRMWWGGVSKDTDKAIMDLLDDGHAIHMLDFGDDGSYFVSYD
ncbi:hypothetical protein MPSEU_000485600 [Mayamaea pseudoterrestris]|nr:hypothetical protein MPSEU_000485600 [Mayamaea pseudoterrestris]